LGRSFRARRGVAGNLCRSAAPSRDGVPGGELDVCGEHERISPDSRGIHGYAARSEEHTSELQSRRDLVCRLLLEKKKKNKKKQERFNKHSDKENHRFNSIFNRTHIFVIDKSQAIRQQ